MKEPYMFYLPESTIFLVVLGYILLLQKLYNWFN